MRFFFLCSPAFVWPSSDVHCQFSLTLTGSRTCAANHCLKSSWGMGHVYGHLPSLSSMLALC